MLNRIQIVNKTLAQKPNKRYLEIGVQKGRMFYRIDADLKVGVDPNFRISPLTKIKNWKLNRKADLSFFKMTSDNFFEKLKNHRLRSTVYDVIFIDGLHTYEQVLKDIHSSLKVLAPNGIIYLHDCLPPNKYAARPAVSIDEFRRSLSKDESHEYGKEWTGDVWKAIAHMRTIENSKLDICVFDCDYGIGTIKRTSQIATTNGLASESLKSKTFTEALPKIAHYLNIKKEDQFDNFLNRIKE